MECAPTIVWSLLNDYSGVGSLAWRGCLAVRSGWMRGISYVLCVAEADVQQSSRARIAWPTDRVGCAGPVAGIGEGRSEPGTGPARRGGGLQDSLAGSTARESVV